jgi:hypothetical protein
MVWGIDMNKTFVLTVALALFFGFQAQVSAESTKYSKVGENIRLATMKNDSGQTIGTRFEQKDLNSLLWYEVKKVDGSWKLTKKGMADRAWDISEAEEKAMSGGC